MISPKKKLEEMSIEELKTELAKLNKLTNFKPKKREAGEDGAIILEPNDPHDREWFKNDEDYNF